MVAVKVAILPSHSILVTTFLSSRTVLICSPIGVLKLSGETALATASAVFSSAYSSVTFASNFLALQLFANQFVDGFDKVSNLVYGYLCACCYVVSSAFAAVCFGS